MPMYFRPHLNCCNYNSQYAVWLILHSFANASPLPGDIPQSSQATNVDWSHYTTSSKLIASISPIHAHRDVARISTRAYTFHYITQLLSKTLINSKPIRNLLICDKNKFYSTHLWIFRFGSPNCTIITCTHITLPYTNTSYICTPRSPLLKPSPIHSHICQLILWLPNAENRLPTYIYFHLTYCNYFS